MAYKIPPPPSSTPQEVRDYFYTVLTQNYDIDAVEAEALVSNWRYGKDKEVRDYDIKTYREIFGKEIGSLLYGYKSGKASSMEPQSSLNSSIAAGAVGSMFFLLAWILYDSLPLAVYFGVLGLVSMAIASGFLLDWRKSKSAKGGQGNLKPIVRRPTVENFDLKTG